MKKNSGFFLVAALCYLIPAFSFTSCTKTNTVTKTVTDTVTKTVTDTLTIKDTTLTTAILTANAWKVQDIRGVIGNTAVYYLRGGV
ncbi:MAG TPA: hypothetical protein VMH01_15550 [Puia sp.]|nr:hypothetical protein [Puia sp.]